MLFSVKDMSSDRVIKADVLIPAKATHQFSVNGSSKSRKALVCRGALQRKKTCVEKPSPTSHSSSLIPQPDEACGLKGKASREWRSRKMGR